MSGDVFGNGMLREQTTKLIAAFDHRDIFIDPKPDPERTFAERKRIFDLPRSSWRDFDKALISDGGGIYSRSAKEIKLSAQAQKLFGVGEKLTPQELIRAILKAQVDLLFFGGIGTYIRASDESDETAGDRANDPIRIAGADLRCKVIGEGANLGMTQRGRIEAASRGVRLNTDAIDNSAGVDTSDHEVNIKIGVDDAIAAFDKCIAADPTRADAYYQKGVNLIGKATLQGDKMVAPPDTAAAFQKYLELQPAGPYADVAKQMLASIGAPVQTGFGTKKKGAKN